MSQLTAWQLPCSTGSGMVRIHCIGTKAKLDFGSVENSLKHCPQFKLNWLTAPCRIDLLGVGTARKWFFSLYPVKRVK